MKWNTTVALSLYLAVFGTAIEARADCKFVRGSIVETRIPSPNDPFGRLLGIVNGVLNGSSTVFITSMNPTQSFDVFVTVSGDTLTAVGSPTRTPIPGQPGEFTTHVDLTVTGGSGRYAEATGTMTFDGISHTLTVPQTVDLVYKGNVCGPNLKSGDD